MNVTIIGTGYVGLVSGACLAEVGNQVLCIDNDWAKTQALHKGIISIYEPGLSHMVNKNITRGRLNFTTCIEDGIEHGDIIFIAVGTPSDEHGSADTCHVQQVAESIGKCINRFCVIVTKSTVPVGTSRLVHNIIKDKLQERGLDIEIAVAANPEFLKEGAAIEDFMKPDRIIVGSNNDQALELLKLLYAPFNRNHDRLIVMDIDSAEMTKYVANAMLATKISFMNEMSNIAERLEVDIESVRIGIGADHRIGYEYIYPGCGYGGSCFPKDVKALHRIAKKVNYDARILKAVADTNHSQKLVPVNKIVKYLGSNLSGKTIALWGLAFKPDTDDMRDAPSRVIVEELWRRGATVQAFDPVATVEARRLYGTRVDMLLFSEDPYEALLNADCLVVATEWRVFRGADLHRIRDTMTGDVIIDARNIFSPGAVKQAGLQYCGMGRQ